MTTLHLTLGIIFVVGVASFLGYMLASMIKRAWSGEESQRQLILTLLREDFFDLLQGGIKWEQINCSLTRSENIRRLASQLGPAISSRMSIRFEPKVKGSFNWGLAVSSAYIPRHILINGTQELIANENVSLVGERISRDIESELVLTLNEMRELGIRVDLKAVKKLRREAQEEKVPLPVTPSRFEREEVL
jgi:hypothetical protein